jgi:predicted nucleic acid-binding protein
MPYLIDTNILVRVIHRADPLRRMAWRALTTLWSNGETLHYTSQILGELWNVCTRPTQARGGLGLTIAQTERRVRLFERNLELLPDSRAVHEEWRRLLVVHAVSGVQVHDARLVAAMRVHGITHLLTFNRNDFLRYPGITAVHPQDI